MLDTNICVFAIKKQPNVLSAIKTHKSSGLCISAITLSELQHGVYNSYYPEKNNIALTNFLTLINVLPYDENAAREYGKLKATLQKNGCLIGNMGMLIAAHAKSVNIMLVTNNTSEFKRIYGLNIVDWTI